MPELPERSKSFNGKEESARPNNLGRHASSTAKPSSIRPATRRRAPAPPPSASSTSNLAPSPEISISKSSLRDGGSQHTRGSIRSSRSLVRPPAGSAAKSPGRVERRRSLSNSGHQRNSSRSLSNSEHRSQLSGSEHRRSISGSEHRRSSLSSSEHRRSTTESSDPSARKTRSGEADSLSKARERLQGRPRAAPSPRTPASRRNMSDGLASDLKKNVPELETTGSQDSGTSQVPRSERTLSKASKSDHRRPRGTRSRSDNSVTSDDDGASLVSSRSLVRGHRSGGASSENADDDASTASKMRSSRGRRAGGSGGGSGSTGGSGDGRRRSRSRSKSTKRRPVRKPTLPAKEPSEKQKPDAPSSSASVMSSTAVKVRRKPASSRAVPSKVSLGAGLAFLDDLAPKPKKQSMGSRSVGADMMHGSSSKSKEPKRRMARNKSSEGLGLAAGLSMLDAMNPKKKQSMGSRSVGADMMMRSPQKSDAPVRRLTRTRSQDAAGISNLAAFLHESSKGTKKAKGSSRSVGGIPMTSSSGDDLLKKPVRRRMKKSGGKSDDDSDYEKAPPTLSRSASVGAGLSFPTIEIDTSKEKKGRKPQHQHSASFGSGLDLYTASGDDETDAPKRGRKPQRRLSSGSNSDLDVYTDSADDADDAGKHNKKPNKKYSGSLSSGLDLYSASSDDDEAPMKRKGRKPIRRLSGAGLGDIDSSLHIGDLLMGSNPGKNEAEKKVQKILSRENSLVLEVPPEEEVDENQDDIFNYYAWSTSMQARPKIQRERQKLSKSIRHGALMSVYESFVRP